MCHFVGGASLSETVASSLENRESLDWPFKSSLGCNANSSAELVLDFDQRLPTISCERKTNDGPIGRTSCFRYDESLACVLFERLS